MKVYAIIFGIMLIFLSIFNISQTYEYHDVITIIWIGLGIIAFIKGAWEM
jgi:hypothetical protein